MSHAPSEPWAPPSSSDTPPLSSDSGEVEIYLEGIDFRRAHFEGLRRFWYLGVWFLFVMGILLAPSVNGASIDLTFVFPAIIAGVALFYGAVFMPLRQFDKMTDAQRRFGLVLEEDGFLVTSALADSQIKWEGTKGVRETPSSFLILLEPRSMLLPKRQLPESMKAKLLALSQREWPQASRQPSGSKLLITWLVLVGAVFLVWQLAQP